MSQPGGKNRANGAFAARRGLRVEHIERLEPRRLFDGQALAAVGDSYYVSGYDLSVAADQGVLANDKAGGDVAAVATLVTPPATGTLTLNPDGSFDYAASGADPNLIQFTYQVTDGSMVSNIATVDLVQQVGQLDPFFGYQGTQYSYSDPSTRTGQPAVAADGSLIVPGRGSDLQIARYLPDGQLDFGFGLGGFASLPAHSAYAAGAVAIQSDGKILVAGQAVTSLPSGDNEFVVARFNADGTLNKSFGTGGTELGLTGFNNPPVVRGLAVDANGNIIVAADVDSRLEVIRLTPSGQQDNTFGAGGAYVSDHPFTIGSQIAIKPGGQILIAGSTPVGGTAQMALLQLDTSGKLDSSFATDGLAVVATSQAATIHALALAPGGDILIAGPAGSQAAPTDKLVVARLNSDGSLDNSFAIGGMQRIPFGSDPNGGTALALQVNGKIVVAQDSALNGAGSVVGVVRLDADGALDTSWNGSGVNFVTATGANLFPSGVVVKPGGQVLVQDYVSTSSPALSAQVGFAQFIGDGVTLKPGLPIEVSWGAPDDTVDIGAQSSATDVLHDALSYTLIGNTNPSVVTATLTGSLLNLSYSTTSAGRAYVTVRISEPDGVYADDVVNVKLDPSKPQAVNDQYTFTPGLALTVNAADGVLANDLPLGFADLHVSYAAPPNHGLLILHPDGSFVYTPNAGYSGFDTFGYELADGDGSISTGTVTLVPGAGVLDPSYGTGGVLTIGFGSSYFAMALQSDDKLLVGGRSNLGLIQRFNSDGTPDLSFGQGGSVQLDAGVNSNVTRLAIEPSGNIVAAGYYTTAGIVGTFVARLLPDGSLDSAFGSGGISVTGADGNSPLSMALAADGSILIEGANVNFSAVGAPTKTILRFAADGTLNPLPDSSSQAAVSTIAVLAEPDGSALVVGFAGEPTAWNLVLRRLSADGSIDASYGAAGTLTVPIGNLTPDAALLTPDGKLIATSTVFGNGFRCAVRLNADGMLDSSFGQGGFATADFPYSLQYPLPQQSYPVLAPDGKLLITYCDASNGKNDVATVRFNADGSLDTRFGQGGQYITSFDTASDMPIGMAVQSDGKLLVAACCGAYVTYSSLGVARYFGDGPIVHPMPAVWTQSFAPGTVVDLAQSFADTAQPQSSLTFAMIGNSNPALAAAKITGSHLAIEYLRGQFGTAAITVRATDSYGQYADTTIDVHVHDVWQNAQAPTDVDQNGVVTPLDALLIINKLNLSGPAALGDPGPSLPQNEYDVNGDGLITPLDALLVINKLNALVGGQSAAAAARALAAEQTASLDGTAQISSAPGPSDPPVLAATELSLAAADQAYLLLGLAGSAPAPAAVAGSRLRWWT